MTTWKSIERPGYFGRRRDEKILRFNEAHGVQALLRGEPGNWRLAWVVGGEAFEFADAYVRWLQARPDDVDFICAFTDCIDNAPTNVHSGTDYTIQEAFSTHIQDIAVRSTLKRLGRWFMGERVELLVIRTPEDNGYMFGPGNIPFYDPSLITQPSLVPRWGTKGTVEDFWQSNKWLQVKD